MGINFRIYLDEIMHYIVKYICLHSEKALNCNILIYCNNTKNLKNKKTQKTSDTAPNESSWVG